MTTGIGPLIELCENAPSRRWLTLPDYRMNLYARCTSRVLDDRKVHKTVDIATVKVGDNHRGKGHFKRFIAEVESFAMLHGLTVFVESVHNARLASHLQRRGYSRSGLDGFSWYLMPKPSGVRDDDGRTKKSETAQV